MAISKGIIKNRKILKSITRIPPKALPHVIKHLEPECINGMAEIIVNILNGVIPLNKQDRKELYKYKSAMRTVGTLYANGKKPSINTTRNILISQKGGFLPAFIIPILKLIGKAALGGVVGGLAHRIVKK